jgi:hypothetical protein
MGPGFRSDDSWDWHSFESFPPHHLRLSLGTAGCHKMWGQTRFVPAMPNRILIIFGKCLILTAESG